MENSPSKHRSSPIIGLTTSLEEQRKQVVTRHYSDWILQSGGTPVILPYLATEEEITRYIELVDGLILTGGGDIDPTLFHEEPHAKLGSITPERDWLELHLIQECLKKNKAILAICRGIQILNVAAGGTMYQDLEAELQGRLVQHSQHAPTWHPSHTVEIIKESQLYQIVGLTQCKTNSFHHQAVREPAPGFRATAFTKDGVIEAIESCLHDFVLGIQWHPECMPLNDTISGKLFQAFVNAAVQNNR